MTTFQLADIQKINEKTDKYIYRNKENGNCIHFHLHPTKSFCFVLDDASRDIDNKIVNKIFNTFFEKGISQHDYKGGFNEAISILSF